MWGLMGLAIVIATGAIWLRLINAVAIPRNRRPFQAAFAIGAGFGLFALFEGQFQGFGILSMIPLSVTILFIYGLIGWVGKDYDMPVAVLSSLTLGLSVDFAIHFLERSRELTKTFGSWKDAIRHMFQEPAMAISRNAIIISIGFTPLLFAPLVPYKTVGFFLATIMAASWIATLFILAALITALQNRLFKKEEITTNQPDQTESDL